MSETQRPSYFNAERTILIQPDVLNPERVTIPADQPVDVEFIQVDGNSVAELSWSIKPNILHARILTADFLKLTEDQPVISGNVIGKLVPRRGYGRT